MTNLLAIAKGLEFTALNLLYSGKSLREAKELPFLTKNDLDCITRYQYGTMTATDHIRLQEVANVIRAEHKEQNK